MSSDCYRVTVLSKKNNRIVLRVATGFAGGRNDYACTRSFALSVLADARRRFNETEQQDLSKGVRFRQVKVETALEKEQAKWPSRWQVSEAFYTAKVGDYVDKTTVGARHNQTRTDTFSAKEHDLLGTLENENLSLTELEDALCAHFHSIELAVEMTDARWLAGIEEGWVFGTTAYDAWSDDPTRPKVPKSTKVQAKPRAPALLELPDAKNATNPEKNSGPKPVKLAGALVPGARVLSKCFAGGVRGVFGERRKATLAGFLAKSYKDHEFGLVTTDDGLVYWENIPNMKALTAQDTYEEGRTSPVEFWAGLLALPMIQRAQEVARVTGSGGAGQPDPKDPQYPPRSRRVAGFLATMSYEQAAHAIAAAFPGTGRPKGFDDFQPFEKSAADFDSSEWKPFVGEKKVTFRPRDVVATLVAGLAWRIAHESEASKKAPVKFVAKEVIDALVGIPEADGWREFMRCATVLHPSPHYLTQAKHGLTGHVADGTGR